MNILYIHQYFKFPNENGGTRSYDLSKEFIKNGHQVIVVTATSNPNFKTKNKWTIIKKENIEVHYLYLPYSNLMSYFKRIRVFFKFLFSSTLHLFRQKSDLILATSTPLTIAIPTLLKKWFSKTPYIFEVRDVWPEAVIAIGAIKNKGIQKMLFFLEKLSYRYASTIIPLSVDMKKSIDKRYPQFKSKTSLVIPNIASIHRFQNEITNPNIVRETIGFQPRFSVLYAGTIGKVNGINKIVELAAQTITIDKGLVYIIIGEGIEKDKIIENAKKRGVLNVNLFILDSIHKDQLPNWYAATSMGSSFVIDIPELWANSANKFFDTLAAKRPVLINYAGWQANVIQKKEVGFVLPQSYTKASIESFVAYTQNKEIWELHCQNALHLAQKEYSLDIAAQKYMTIFDVINH